MMKVEYHFGQICAFRIDREFTSDGNYRIQCRSDFGGLQLEHDIKKHLSPSRDGLLAKNVEARLRSLKTEVDQRAKQILDAKKHKAEQGELEKLDTDQRTDASRLEILQKLHQTLTAVEDGKLSFFVGLKSQDNSFTFPLITAADSDVAK